MPTLSFDTSEFALLHHLSSSVLIKFSILIGNSESLSSNSSDFVMFSVELSPSSCSSSHFSMRTGSFMMLWPFASVWVGLNYSPLPP